MADEVVIIRAGFTSNAFLAGSAVVDIKGTFTTEDAEDLVMMLELAIRVVRRQASLPEPPSPTREESSNG